jgi:hypothetical protein
MYTIYYYFSTSWIFTVPLSITEHQQYKYETNTLLLKRDQNITHIH